MYAITDAGFRAIASADEAQPGETVVAVLPQSLLDEIARSEARQARNDRLRFCDWTQLADSTLTDTQRAEWATYRQSLRDLPQQPDFPGGQWPQPPELPPNAGVAIGIP